MKRLLTIILFLSPALSFSQDVIFVYPGKKQVDSLQQALRYANNDSSRLLIYRTLGSYYIERNNAIAGVYHTKAMALARKLKQRLWEALTLNELCYEAYEAGDYPQALNLANSGLKIAEDEDCEKNLWRPTEFSKDGDPHKARLYLLAILHEKLGYLYLKTGNNAKCTSSYFDAIKIAMSVDDKVGLSFYNEDLGDYYLSANKLDSALYFTNKGLELAYISDYRLYEGALLANIGQVYFRRGNYALAKQYFFKSIKAHKEQLNDRFLPLSYIMLADLYRSTGKIDSDIYYARLGLRDFKTVDDLPNLAEAYTTLYTAYKLLGKKDSAFLYLQRSKALGDSLNVTGKAKLSQYLSIGFNDQLRVQELEKEKIQVETRNRTYIMLGGIGIFVIIASILYRNNKQKQKANKVLESTLTNLKTTQTQLIQSEKMASLGELTAGIAHEIQNPLNFVNNFSDVNTELLEEMRQEIERGDLEEVKAIAIDIQENEKKINMHGKRADGIVKGMLQHSKAGSGTKEPVNINTLAEEYMRLSYHGLSSKDKSFHAETATYLDERLPKVNAIPQDIGKVLFNLFNNAFYAVNLKQKTADDNYKPEVSMTTLAENDRVIIKVKDNGVGISDSIKDKIMQPFFTTKPTGEGTGLGLSLTYDMVVKGHGGTIDVKTQEGEYSEFIVALPLS